jgi:pre-mRNA-splicing factor SPF27
MPHHSSTFLLTSITNPQKMQPEPQIQEIPLDSLPYIDQVHPDYEAYALTLIEEEMQSMQPPAPVSYSYESMPEFKSSTGNSHINQNEYKNLVDRNGQPRKENIDFCKSMRAKSSPPKKQDSVSDWQSAVQHAKEELEHERIRQTNLDLETEFSSSIWKHHVKIIERSATATDKQLQDQLLEVDQINARRKEMQEVQAMNQLGKLNFRWEELIKKNQYLKRGVGEVENEVMTLREKNGVVLRIDDVQKMDDDDDM